MKRKTTKTARRQEPDELTPAQVRELEQRLFQLGVKKYGLDEKTARQAARLLAAA